MTAAKILVVEDNTIQREGLAVVLRQQGYTVLQAVDGDDALNRLSGEPVPDLILLDMLIPDAHGDGWWFLQQRQRIPALGPVPVIIITALPVASREWAVSLGAEGLIRKPFKVEPLLAEVRRWLER